MEDGEATVLGLRRSKPLFFSLGGSFSYSKQPHKRLPVSLATSPSDLGPFISLPSLSMTCPHQGSYKISPFPMKHQQTFWRVWLSPRWISGVSTPPPPPPLSSLIPTSPLSSTNTTPLWANLRSSTSPVTGSGHGNTEQDKGRAAEEGETCTKPFSWRSQCCWWEEDALRAAGGAWYGFHRSVLLNSACSGCVRKICFCSETLCEFLLLHLLRSQTFLCSHWEEECGRLALDLNYFLGIIICRVMQMYLWMNDLSHTSVVMLHIAFD